MNAKKTFMSSALVGELFQWSIVLLTSFAIILWMILGRIKRVLSIFTPILADDIGMYQELPEGMPPQDDEEDPSYLGLPGFITQYEACVQPPSECPNENITFWFYTRFTQNNPVQIDMSRPESINEIKPTYGKPWKLIIHGYTGWRDYAPNPEIRPAYLQNGDYNIISVDYGPIAQSPCYWSAASNVPLVANCTAQVVDALIGKGFLNLPELHVVGFSLGGQVAGHIHLFLKSGVIRRISALDPALPLFLTTNVDARLDSSDASFVDVIHTNAAWKGQFLACGHVDFYPNGGYSQPGCSPAEYGSMSSCNHARAVVYFAESIYSDEGFWGVPCGSSVTYNWGWCPANETNQLIMGEYTPETSRGIYYLTTSESSPFAMGKYGENEIEGSK